MPCRRPSPSFGRTGDRPSPAQVEFSVRCFLGRCAAHIWLYKGALSDAPGNPVLAAPLLPLSPLQSPLKSQDNAL